MNIEEELQIIAAVPNGFKPMENFANRLAETYPEEQLEKNSIRLLSIRNVSD